MEKKENAPSVTCKTCSSEIVATVNDSVFGDGECNACEYGRYKTQPECLEVLDELLSMTIDLDLATGNELTGSEKDLLDKAITLLGNYYGNAA